MMMRRYMCKYLIISVTVIFILILLLLLQHHIDDQANAVLEDDTLFQPIYDHSIYNDEMLII